MKTSTQVRLFSALESSLPRVSVVMLALSLLGSPARAATTVDVFQDMQSGNNGDVLTSTIMNASSHPNGYNWFLSVGTMWVSTAHYNGLPGPVVAGGVTYNGTGGTRTWVYNNNNANNCIGIALSSYTHVTVACFYTTGNTVRNTTQYDTIGMSGVLGLFSVMQNINAGTNPQLRSHSKDSSGTTVFGPTVDIVTNKSYWVNLHYSSTELATTLGVYDPANGYALVGTSVCGSMSDWVTHLNMGRTDNHGNVADPTQSWFGNVLIDYTNAAFPLIPSSGGNQPPSAPANVRDGTGSDITYTTSNTQLSANWDASTDPDGSVTAYQYAIGTSAGGTQTVNWTTLGNVTTVTKTGLSLTNGQTYYFSVKAVDNQGLAGNATNSNGQTVDTTAPGAPANVRDGTGTDISTTSSTTQLSANWDAAADAESGISGYQYAIGTSAGGTQTVNWTSLGNVTTVTKTGLSLSVGQTYYFSVRAVNGAGLTGSATNSNGQTVVSVGSVVYFQDNFESWTVHGGAWSSVNGESSTHTLDTSVDYAKAGAKCLKITDSDTTATTGASLTKNFSPVISTDIYVRFFIFLPTGYGSANSSCARRILRVNTDTSNYAVLSLVGDGLAVYEVGGWSGTSPTAMSENAWHCVELHVAPPSASTAIQYWIDGTSAGTCTGAFSGSSTFNYMQLGDVYLATGSANSTGTFYLDELVVSNSYVGTGIAAPVTYFSDTFDSWAVHGGAWSSVSGETSTHTLNTSTDFARSGTKSLKLTDTDTTSTTGAFLTKTFSPAISGDAYVRFYVYLPTGYGSTNANCNRRMLQIHSGSTNKAVLVARADAMYVQESIGWTGTAGIAISEGQWHCIEVHVTPPATVTVLEFWVDGVYQSALTANFSAASTWTPIDFGDPVIGSGNNGTGTFYLDEFVAASAYNGPLP